MYVWPRSAIRAKEAAAAAAEEQKAEAARAARQAALSAQAAKATQPQPKHSCHVETIDGVRSSRARAMHDSRG